MVEGSSFELHWRQFHARLWPVGYMLRRGGAQGWVRFHSLPQSKRYAHTPDERAILLARQQTLAAAALGSDPCWIVQTHWITPPGSIDHGDAVDPFRATRDWKLKFVFEFSEEESEDVPRWRAYAARTEWVPGRFDHLLLAIADNRAGPTLWMSQTNGAIFAPYDGGVDMFLPSKASRDFLARAHAGWLSSRPDGL